MFHFRKKYTCINFDLDIIQTVHTGDTWENDDDNDEITMIIMKIEDG